MDSFLLQGTSLARSDQIFTAKPVDLEPSTARRFNRFAAASGSVLTAFQGGDVARWYPEEEEFTLIDFGKERIGEVSRLLLDPTGFHALMTNSSGDTWYLNFQSSQAQRLSKLKGVVESASWDVEGTTSSTKDLLLGTRGGQLLLMTIVEGKEKALKTLCDFDAAPVVGIHRERVFSQQDGLERLVLFVAAGCSLYAFIGVTLESLFQRYQGERVTRARVYEVPYASPNGDLQVDDACVGPLSSKVIFWLTGVGVLAAKVQSTLDEEVAASTLESPPGLVAFPSKSTTSMSFLPPAPPTAPQSMALTRYHLIFAYEDRWMAVSRITHEVVQQADWAMSTYGPMRSLARDVHMGKLWLCSERHAFEIACESEERNVWVLLLRLEQFDDALNACSSESQRQRVLAAQADHLFRQQMDLAAARKFAEASAVPFEHVALRFLGADRKEGFLEYLKCRLARADDQVTRSLLSVWAVELSLARLNELREAGEDALAASRARLVELLKQCMDLEVHATIYHLLQSHGWLEELALFAELRKDYSTVILLHVSRRDCAAAVRKLQHFAPAQLELVSRFAPVLFGTDPAAFASLLLRSQLSALDPLQVLPAIYSQRPSHRVEALRYLDHAVLHRDETRSSFRAGGLLENLEDQHGSPACGWSSGTGILNAMVVLLAEQGSDEALLAFLEAQEANELMDCQFALRICSERGLVRPMVQLYGLMGMHEEAVAVALQREDLALAKSSACKPRDALLRQKLWLQIAAHEAAHGDVQRIIGLIRESTELTVRDVLPYLPDSMTIDAFKMEICECLDTYEGQIVTLRQEMDDHRRALTSFKEDLKRAEERCIVVAADQCCEICGQDAMSERFYAYTCTHCIHEACLRALILPTLTDEKRQRLLKLEELRLQHQAAAAGAAPKAPKVLAEVEEELDSLLAEDCPFCGQIMIDAVLKPFVDLSDSKELDEMQTWEL